MNDHETFFEADWNAWAQVRKTSEMPSSSPLRLCGKRGQLGIKGG
jgi:hypothetical protein